MQGMVCFENPSSLPVAKRLQPRFAGLNGYILCKQQAATAVNVPFMLKLEEEREIFFTIVVPFGSVLPSLGSEGYKSPSRKAK